VQTKENEPVFIIVDTGTILGVAHLVLEEDSWRLVNSRIDLRAFNKVYYGIRMKESALGYM